jgi:hypothetical protein
MPLQGNGLEYTQVQRSPMMVIHLYLLIYVAITYYIGKTLLTGSFLLEQNGCWMVWLVFLLSYLSSVSLGIMRHGIGVSRFVILWKTHMMHFIL